jgi:arginyl-tRNA--protein-N-Asp/Glu arginylyltransferase
MSAKSPYLHWAEKTITDFAPQSVRGMYEDGWVFTRIGRGVMHQTRSLRINLSKFELSSENRRILKKLQGVDIMNAKLPYDNYSWIVGKMAKDFYEKKFGPGIMTANKIKELVTDTAASNFNTLLIYGGQGYCISYAADSMLHYSYPFYDMARSTKDMGMGMMIQAILHAKETGLSHIYLGSLQRPGDTYKLQFKGIEWFDEKKWREDTEEVKKILTEKTEK